MDDHLLHIEDLKMHFRTRDGFVRAVDGVDIALAKGERLGLVGESGCGKTTLIKAVLRLLPPYCLHVGGAVHFLGQDLTRLNKNQMRRIRWQHLSLIPQSAMNALNPVHRVGDQIVEVIRAHENKTSVAAARERAAVLFEMVGLDPGRLKDYPHLFSGGMKQRAVIAMAMALEPEVVIADEPTTALDVVIQAQILDRIQALQSVHQGSMIMVTHDISVVAQTCDKVAVMYGGRVFEYGPVAQIVKNPFHPYSMGLKNAFPNLLGERKTLISIPGSPPDLVRPPAGCRFAPRCPFALDICRNEEPRPAPTGEGLAACHRLAEAETLRSLAEKEETWSALEESLVQTG